MKLQMMIACGTEVIALSFSQIFSASNISSLNSHPIAAHTYAQRNGELRYKAPAGWVSEQPSSRMRAAQFRLPKAEGDSEDATLVLYYFGSDQGGSVRDNIDRWISQIKQPDGSSSGDKAKMETLTPNGLKVTTVDLTGTYIAETSPGSGVRFNKPNYRLRAAVVETPKGNYYAKLVGPERTVKRWDRTFIEYINSFEFKKAEAVVSFH